MQVDVLGPGQLAIGGDHTLEHLLQTGGLRHQQQLTRLYLGPVQDVIDDMQQVLAGVLRHLEHLLLLALQTAATEQIHHAQHTAQGRAYLVTHGGEESILGLIGMPQLQGALLHTFRQQGALILNLCIGLDQVFSRLCAT